MIRTISPHYQVVVKPHPAEDIIEWKKTADESGFRVMESDYIWNLLAMSDLHIARSACMTLCEAWMMNVPTIGIPLGDECVKPGAANEAIDLTPIAIEPSHLADMVEDYLVDESVVDETDFEERRYRYIKTWIMPESNGGSCSLVATKLLELLGSSPPDDIFSIGDDVNLSQLVLNHSKNYSKPGFDHVGQYNKTVTQQVVNEWVSRIGSL